MGVDRKSSVTGRFQPFPAKGLGQPQHTQTSSVSLFRVLALTHDHLDKGLGIGANSRGLPSDPFRGPVFTKAVMGGHMVTVCGMLMIAR